MKKTITAITLAMVLMVSTSFANGGLIVSDLTGGTQPDPCKANAAIAKTVKVDSGIIIAGFTGIIIAGFTGIIIAGVSDNTPVNCGIIIAG